VSGAAANTQEKNASSPSLDLYDQLKHVIDLLRVQFVEDAVASSMYWIV